MNRCRFVDLGVRAFSKQTMGDAIGGEKTPKRGCGGARTLRIRIALLRREIRVLLQQLRDLHSAHPDNICLLLHFCFAQLGSL